MSELQTDDLVSAYVAIRAERDKLKQEYEANDAVLKEQMAGIGSVLLSICNSINADSIKTAHGTVMRRLNERFTCGDWDNFYKYILDNGAVHLLERRIHQGNIKEYLSGNEGAVTADGLPPGISVMREYDVSVRKASK